MIHALIFLACALFLGNGRRDTCSLHERLGLKHTRQQGERNNLMILKLSQMTLGKRLPKTAALAVNKI